MQLNFTKKSITGIAPPEQGVITIHDLGKKGLKLFVRATGLKTFFLYKKINGLPERITIGRFPETTIEQARRQVDILNAQIASGINPNEEKRSVRSEITLGELFLQYLDRHAKIHKRSWKEDQSQFNRYLQKWSTKKLGSLTKAQIQRVHAQIGVQHGFYAANRLLSLLHIIFNKATEWGWEGKNPAHGIKKFKEKSRDRFLEADELPRFFKALSDEPNQTIKDYVLLSLLTGARRSNVLSMQWQDINLQRCTWTIPQTKNGESHTVPLVSAALEILQDRQAEKNNQWVFPSNSAKGHLMDPKKNLEKKFLIRLALKI